MIPIVFKLLTGFNEQNNFTAAAFEQALQLVQTLNLGKNHSCISRVTPVENI